MTRYIKGQTSKEIILKQRAITQSIKNENTALLHALDTDQLPKSMPISNEKVTLGMIQKWCDNDLQIIRYSSNTGQNKGNADLTVVLKSTIAKLNLKLKQKTLSKNQPQRAPHKKNTKGELELELKELKANLETMKRTVAEVYRAYMQLSHMVTSDQQDFDKFRMSLRKQSEEMRHRLLKVVK